MKSLKYFLVIVFTIFSFYYTDKVIELSEYNNTILASINDYASLFDQECKEGQINENGIILGLSGVIVDKNKSYSNMKGIGFREDLLEYKNTKCILNKEDNLDKYIISSNNNNRNISLVIDVLSLDYYQEMLLIAQNENIELNLLVNNSFNDIESNNNYLYKTNKNDIKSFKKKVDNFYCVKYNDFDLLEYCKKEKTNSITISHYIEKDLLLYMKKNLDKGNIYFIKENKINTSELHSTIKYIKSRGYNILNIDELLS